MIHSSETPEDFALRIGRESVTLARMWRRSLARRLMAHGVADAHWALLDCLVRSGDGISQNQLAQRLGLEKSAMVRVLREMEHADYIQRSVNPADRRNRLVRLTPHGRATGELIFAEIRQFEAPLLDVASREELALYSELVQRFTQKIEAMNIEAGFQF